jgi:hypothetical protein
VLDSIQKDFLLEPIQLPMERPGWQNQSRISMQEVYAKHKNPKRSYRKHSIEHTSAATKSIIYSTSEYDEK